MGKGEQNWPRSNQELPSLQAPSNTLYPDRNQNPRNNYGPVDNLSSGSRPPWHANRGDFGTSQIPRSMTPPWSRDARFDSQLKDSKGWNSVRQSAAPFNPQSIRTNSIGWSKPDENIPQWRKQDPIRMDMRGNGPNDLWKDRPMAGEGSGGYFPKGANELLVGSQGPPKLSLEDRYRGGPPSQKWSKPMDKDPDWFNRMDNSDWNDKPVRHPDWRERSQEMGMFEFKGPTSGPLNTNRLGEETGWRRPSDRPLNDSWDMPRRQPESLMKVGNLARDSNRDWGRNYDDAERLNRPMIRQEEAGYWWPPGPGGEPKQRNMFNEPGSASARGEQNFSRNSGPVGGPFSEREFSRKRARSPENRNVWNRLEPHSLLNELPAAKILRACEQLDTGIGKDVLAMIERERMELNFPKPAQPPPLIEPTPRTPNKDLRHKLAKKDLPVVKGQTEYKVCIVPEFKKSRFQLRHKDHFFDKLIADLYKMAKSDDTDNLPQLRFNGLIMESQTRLVVRCPDATTAKWFLNWDHGYTAFPVRKILPEDPLHLAVIGFDIKGVCDINTDNMKFYLKVQNPGLDISCWRDGQIKTSKKGKMYLYKVDGHTLRYLINNKWELFFDMQRLFVKHFRTNFPFNPQTYALL